jgi:hypothetical protein
MKTSFLTAGGITLVLAILWIYLLVTLVTAGCRKKYFPGSPPNLAQGIMLAGKYLAGVILVTGLFGPIRDYLLVSSSVNLEKPGALLSFLLIGCCLLGIAFAIAAAFESFLSRQVFKGQSVIVELQENNLAVAVLRAVLVSAIALAFLFGSGLVMQSFIQVPTIPNIR